MPELTPGRLRELLPETSMMMDATATDRDDAIRQAGEALVRSGAVDGGYIEAMLEREHTVTTYIGDGIAMPHGTVAAKNAVRSEALVLLRYPYGVDWNGDRVTLVLGVAARDRRYIALISQLAAVLLEPSRAAAMRGAETAEEVYAVFGAKTLAT